MKITIVVVTHEMSVVQSICQRMAILDGGSVSLVGDVHEIFRNKPEQLKTLMGEEDWKVSVTMGAEDFARIKRYLDENGTNYRVSGGA